ncbi:MAG: helix-turn-helix domain-containing protein [Burkholderiaceae bacterium]|jgi:transposase|nr:helix-turn-helix domain-containing protein [Burkholderiaceae bacterium]
MRQTEMHLSETDRQKVAEIRTKGLRHARAVNRAHILWCLDQGVPEAQIMAVLGIGRTALWRTRAAYLQGGLELALFDLARPGRPRKYGADIQAQVTELASSPPPPGRARWTMAELHQAIKHQQGLPAIGRETVRRMLKKNA